MDAPMNEFARMLGCENFSDLMTTLGYFLLLCGILILVAMLVAILASFWKIFQKAGLQGWEALIPGWNVWVLAKILRISPLWFLLLLVLPFPVLPLVGYLRICVALARLFGEPAGTGLAIAVMPCILLPYYALGKTPLQLERDDA